jgi:hypothetical protein
MTDTKWLRVRKDRPCPICHRTDWCMVVADGSVALCARVSNGAVKAVGDKGAGWLHRLRAGDQRHRTRGVAIPSESTEAPDFPALVERYCSAADPVWVRQLAGDLGVFAPSLHRLRVGWDGDAFTFPMQDPTGRIVGIRRRFPSGRKLSVKGGHEGLFIPSALPADGTLLVCEGPTDTAALLDLGFAAIGRPSCAGGTRYLVTLARGREVVIVADADPPGERGAAVLAATLRIYCPLVRTIAPPAGIKDARAWKQAGATPGDLLASIAPAPILRSTVKRVGAHGRARAGVQ